MICFNPLPEHCPAQLVGIVDIGREAAGSAQVVGGVPGGEQEKSLQMFSFDAPCFTGFKVSVVGARWQRETLKP